MRELDDGTFTTEQVQGPGGVTGEVVTPNRRAIDFDQDVNSGGAILRQAIIDEEVEADRFLDIVDLLAEANDVQTDMEIIILGVAKSTGERLSTAADAVTTLRRAVDRGDVSPVQLLPVLREEIAAMRAAVADFERDPDGETPEGFMEDLLDKEDEAAGIVNEAFELRLASIQNLRALTQQIGLDPRARPCRSSLRSPGCPWHRGKERPSLVPVLVKKF